jgi:uncharacterized integral membrane protein
MQIVRWIVAAAIFLALLFLSLQNAEPVALKLFHVATWQAPLVVVVFAAVAAGVAAGLLAGALRASRLKRQLNRLRREHARGQRDGPAGPQDAVSAPGAPGAPGAPRHHAPLDRLPDGL